MTTRQKAPAASPDRKPKKPRAKKSEVENHEPREGELAVWLIEDPKLRLFARQAIKRSWLMARHGKRRGSEIVRKAELDQLWTLTRRCRSADSMELVIKRGDQIAQVEAIVSSGLIVKGEPKIQPAEWLPGGNTLKALRRLLWWLVTG